MKPLDTTQFSLQALRRYPLRTSMLLLAIAIGVAAVVMLTAVGEGARRYVTGQFQSLGTNLLIVLPGKSDTAGGGGIEGLLIGETARELTLQDTIAIAKLARVRQVTPVVVGAGTVSTRARVRDITVVGTSESMASIQHWTVGLGRFLPPGELDVASPVCVLGYTVAHELYGEEIPVGQWLRIGDARCRVVGVLARQGLAGGFKVDETVILPVANAQQIFNTSAVFRILVEATSRDSVKAAKADIVALIKARHAGTEDITVITQDALVSTFDTIFGMITAGLAAIAAISLIVAGVLIMNVMLVAVSQRTAEIGLLKALGAPGKTIRRAFLSEAALLSLAGAVLGFLLGHAGAFALRWFYPTLPAYPPVWAVVAALGSATATGLLFGVMPARRAARLDPVQALAKR